MARFLAARAQNTSNHIIQLDGLRAVAVVCVILHHYSLVSWGDLGYFAFLGVKLFSVLSGFLITGILLRARQVAEEKNINKWFCVRQFYIRRALRIFPLYYFVILVGVAINLEPAREIVGWLATYTVNFYIIHTGYFIDNFAHFWSLAIEEQFYLVWPWLIFFIPRRAIPMAILICVLAGPLYRLFYVLDGAEGLAGYISTLSSLDSLGLGAIVAYGMYERKNIPAIQILVLGLSGWIMLEFFKVLSWWRAPVIGHDFFISLVFCWVIVKTTTGFNGPVGFLLESKPAQYLGKISYGLYVYHPLMLNVCRDLLRYIGYEYPKKGIEELLICASVTFIVTALSWKLLEEPINRLKTYFEYDGSFGKKISQNDQMHEVTCENI